MVYKNEKVAFCWKCNKMQHLPRPLKKHYKKNEYMITCENESQQVLFCSDSNSITITFISSNDTISYIFRKKRIYQSIYKSSNGLEYVTIHNPVETPKLVNCLDYMLRKRIVEERSSNCSLI